MIAASTRFPASLAPAVAIIATLGQGVVGRPRQAPPPPSLEVSKLTPAALEKYAADWRAAVRAHVAGRFDEPAAAIARWPDELTRAVVDRAIRQLQREREAARMGAIGGDDSAAIVAKGLLLHTDIAIVVRTGSSGPATGTPDALMLDAKPYGSRPFSIHWIHARVIADVLTKAPTRERNAIGGSSIEVARAWYRAVGALFQQWADLGRLHARLDHAGGVLADDPVLLLYEGTLHQGYADARLQAYLAQWRQSMGLPEGAIGVGRHRLTGSYPAFDTAPIELELAERALRRALAQDPSLVEAQIRLAHVHDARGRPAEAALLARQALAEPLSGFLEFYAAMVLGRATARRGDPAEARAAFERAAARFPRSQAARVALSHVAIGGSPGMASEAVVRALGPDGLEVTDDPWALYFRLHEPSAQAQLAALRASVQ